MVDVFISYPRVERAAVEPIRAKLVALGLEVFFDIHGIDGGADFPDVIDKNLRLCKAVLSCWSPLYFEQRWCMIECRAGLDKNVLVPVAIKRFAKDAPPADLRFLNYFDLSDWGGQVQHEDWQRTLRTLSRMTGRSLPGILKALPERDRPPAATTRPHTNTPQDFSLKSWEDVKAASTARPSNSSRPGLEDEADHWRAIRKSSDPGDFLEYLARYGADGAFSEVAKLILKRLNTSR